MKKTILKLSKNVWLSHKWIHKRWQSLWIIPESNKVATSGSKKIAKVMIDKKTRVHYGKLQLEAILNDTFGEQTQIVKKRYKINSGFVYVALEINGTH